MSKANKQKKSYLYSPYQNEDADDLQWLDDYGQSFEDDPILSGISSSLMHNEWEDWNDTTSDQKLGNSLDKESSHSSSTTSFLMNNNLSDIPLFPAIDFMNSKGTVFQEENPKTNDTPLAPPDCLMNDNDSCDGGVVSNINFPSNHNGTKNDSKMHGPTSGNSMFIGQMDNNNSSDSSNFIPSWANPASINSAVPSPNNSGNSMAVDFSSNSSTMLNMFQEPNRKNVSISMNDSSTFTTSNCSTPPSTSSISVSTFPNNSNVSSRTNNLPTDIKTVHSSSNPNANHSIPYSQNSSNPTFDGTKANAPTSGNILGSMPIANPIPPMMMPGGFMMVPTQQGYNQPRGKNSNISTATANSNAPFSMVGYHPMMGMMGMNMNMTMPTPNLMMPVAPPGYYAGTTNPLVSPLIQPPTTNVADGQKILNSGATFSTSASSGPFINILKKPGDAKPSKMLEQLLNEEATKRDARLERNRNSARDSRKKQQSYVENIEAVIKILTQEKSNLSKYKWGFNQSSKTSTDLEQRKKSLLGRGFVSDCNNNGGDKDNQISVGSNFEKVDLHLRIEKQKQILQRKEQFLMDQKNSSPHHSILHNGYPVDTYDPNQHQIHNDIRRIGNHLSLSQEHLRNINLLLNVSKCQLKNDLNFLDNSITIKNETTEAENDEEKMMELMKTLNLSEEQCNRIQQHGSQILSSERSPMTILIKVFKGLRNLSQKFAKCQPTLDLYFQEHLNDDQLEKLVVFAETAQRSILELDFNEETHASAE